MAEYFKHTGQVVDVEHTNGPIKFGLGTQNGQYWNVKRFQVWPTDYETKEPNEAAAIIDASEGQTVTVTYATKQETYNGKTFPKNTVYGVVAGEGQQGADSAPSSAGTSPDPTRWIDRLIDLEKRLAALEDNSAPPVNDSEPSITADDIAQKAMQRGLSVKLIQQAYQDIGYEGSWIQAAPGELVALATKLNLVESF